MYDVFHFAKKNHFLWIILQTFCLSSVSTTIWHLQIIRNILIRLHIYFNSILTFVESVVVGG